MHYAADEFKTSCRLARGRSLIRWYVRTSTQIQSDDPRRLLILLLHTTRRRRSCWRYTSGHSEQPLIGLSCLTFVRFVGWALRTVCCNDGWLRDTLHHYIDKPSCFTLSMLLVSCIAVTSRHSETTPGRQHPIVSAFPVCDTTTYVHTVGLPFACVPISTATIVGCTLMDFEELSTRPSRDEPFQTTF